MSDLQSHAIDPWIEILWEHGGSDLLLSGGSAPRIRVDGKLGPIVCEKLKCPTFVSGTSTLIPFFEEETHDC